MNFFGHAAVACAHSTEPRYVFGAMLPDLCPMAGQRPARARDPAVHRGVELHHRTDRLFHAAPAFVALCADALERLTDAGLTRASARAVGHVGSELLLDGFLAERGDGAYPVYVSALSWASDSPLDEALELSTEAAAADLDRLVRRLRRAPVPHAYRDPGFVAERLETILARRPRLALAQGDGAAVERWLTDVRRRVDAHGAEMVEELVETLHAERLEDA